MKLIKGYLIIFLLIIFILLLGVNIAINLSEEKLIIPRFTLKEDPLNTLNYIQVKLDVFPDGIVLSQDCQGIIMNTHILQTSSIASGVKKEIEIRPNSHDLMKEMLDQFNLQLKMVKIERMEDGIYYADIILGSNNKIINLDSKPSDAIALAVRSNVPVYVKNDLFNNIKQNVC